jgi:hypothetical protein
LVVEPQRPVLVGLLLLLPVSRFLFLFSPQLISRYLHGLHLARYMALNVSSFGYSLGLRLLTSFFPSKSRSRGEISSQVRVALHQSIPVHFMTGVVDAHNLGPPNTLYTPHIPHLHFNWLNLLHSLFPLSFCTVTQISSSFSLFPLFPPYHPSFPRKSRRNQGPSSLICEY